MWYNIIIKLNQIIKKLKIKKMEFETVISILYLLLAIFHIWVYINLKSYKEEKKM